LASDARLTASGTLSVNAFQNFGRRILNGGVCIRGTALDNSEIRLLSGAGALQVFGEFTSLYYSASSFVSADTYEVGMCSRTETDWAFILVSSNGFVRVTQ
jgi:hypothetical protein